MSKKTFTASPWHEALAAQLRAERQAARLTGDTLAERAGISRSAYWRLEKPARELNMDQLTHLCGVLGIRVSEFIRRAEERMVSDGLG